MAFLQGHWTHFQTSQTNIFSSLDDIQTKSQWFLESLVVQIYARGINYCFNYFTQPL